MVTRIPFMARILLTSIAVALFSRVADAIVSIRPDVFNGHVGAVGLDTPPIAALQFLLISSPAERKIVWTTLQNLESSDGRAYPLVDSGLQQPSGIAFDHNRGFLYVADTGAKKIFRYTILVATPERQDMATGRPTISTTGMRLTVVENQSAEWLAVDESGNLLYTCTDTHNINMVSREILHLISTGDIRPSSLQVVSQKVITAQEVARQEQHKRDQAKGDPIAAMPTDAPEMKPQILSVYEAAANPHVAAPASIWVDGPNLYWTNQRDGTTAGTVVIGKVHPQLNISSKAPQPFAAHAVTSSSNAAFGLSKTEKIIFFSRDGDKPQSGAVTGRLLGTDIELDFVTSLIQPRGLVWDKDQTVYVADQYGGSVWSFPVGRMMKDAPLTRTVSMKGSFGLVILSSQDACFNANKVKVKKNSDDTLLEYPSLDVEVLADPEKTVSGDLMLLQTSTDAKRSNPISILALALTVGLCALLWTTNKTAA